MRVNWTVDSRHAIGSNLQRTRSNIIRRCPDVADGPSLGHEGNQVGLSERRRQLFMFNLRRIAALTTKLSCISAPALSRDRRHVKRMVGRTSSFFTLTSSHLCLSFISPVTYAVLIITGVPADRPAFVRHHSSFIINCTQNRRLKHDKWTNILKITVKSMN